MTLLTFPEDPLPIRAEMRISGTWTDITSRIRGASEIIISGRGRANEQGRPSPCTCSFVVENADNYFSNRAPLGANFGLIPEYTPVRVSVTEDRSFALYDSSDGCYVKTTDKAVLDITSEIDIRVEFELDNQPDGIEGPCLAAKRASGGQASWLFVIRKNGLLRFVRSVDGSALLSIDSTIAPDSLIGPMAVRVTFDGDDGAGNRVAKFYTSDSNTIAGPWTQLGATVTLAGTSSIFSSTADLELGRHNGGVNGGITEITGLIGRIYAFELYSGIASPTLVAEADIYNQARGTTSFSDGLGTPNTWTVNGTCEITPDNRRFTGELVSIQPTADISGNGVTALVQVADVTRRLGRDDVVNSPLGNFFGAMIDDSTGYWKFEDGTEATTAANFKPGGERGQITDVQFGTPSDLPATSGSLTINSTNTRVRLNAKIVANTGFACFNWAMKMASTPGADVTIFDLLMTGGNIARVNFTVSATTYELTAYDAAGVELGGSGTLHGTNTPPNVWNLFRIQLEQVGANVDMDLGWYHPGDDVLVGAATATFAATAGRFYQFRCVGATNNVGTQLSHAFMGQFFLNNATVPYVQAASAFAGETTTARFLRVCEENGISGRIVGTDDFAERMGTQQITLPLNILYECGDTELGFVYPDRNTSDLLLRTRRSLVNQQGPEVAYSGELGVDIPRGTDDDGTLRNTVVARRPDGSTGFAQRTTGEYGTAAIGVVPGSVDRNTYTTDRLNDMAAWDAVLGTWYEYRWTLIPVSFERTDFSGTAAKVLKAHRLASLDVGDLLVMTGPPPWVPSDDVQLLIQGLPTEILGNRKWHISWNTTPYGPYKAGVFGVARYDSGSTSTNTTYSSSATSIVFSTTVQNDIWSTTAEPYDVIISGETMTVTSMGAVSGSGPYLQTATVTRGTGGFSKALPSGASIHIATPGRYGL